MMPAFSLFMTLDVAITTIRSLVLLMTPNVVMATLDFQLSQQVHSYFEAKQPTYHIS